MRSQSTAGDLEEEGAGFRGEKDMARIYPKDVLDRWGSYVVLKPPKLGFVPSTWISYDIEREGG